MKHLGFALVFLILQLNALAYSEKEYFTMRDSLMHKLEHSTGRNMADALFELARFILPFEPELADSLVGEQFKLSKKLNYASGTAAAFQNRGMLYYFEDDFTASIENFMEALRLFEEDENYTEIGRTYLRLLLVFHFTGNMDMVYDYYPRIISAFEKGNNQIDLAVIYYWMGYHHNNIDIRPETASLYLRKSLEICRKEKAGPVLVAGVYGSLALAHTRANQFDSAIVFLRTSNSYLLGDSDDEKLARLINYEDMGDNFFYSGQLDSARHYYISSINKAQEISYLFILASSGLNLGQISKLEGDMPQTFNYLNMAYQAALEINRTGMFFSDPEKRYASEWVSDAWPDIPKYFNKSGKKFWARRSLRSISFNLSQFYESTGNPGKALEYYQFYHAWSDSLNRISRKREMLSMQLEYETALKDRRIEALSQSNELKELRMRQYILFLIGLGAFIVLSIAVLLLLMRQRHLKGKQEKLVLEHKLLRSQMNPHFIFNSLASIQNKIINEEPQVATDYLARFSHLFRNILEGSVEEFIPLEKEIDMVKNYLELQKVRYSGKFNYNIFVDEKLEPAQVNIPPMLTQPFIENAIEHGMRYKSETGNISVSYLKQNGNIRIEIEDDGIGRQRARELMMQHDKDHKSMATAITLERIDVLNKKFKKKITLQIIDLGVENGEPKGTRVVFSVPV
jgi:tetratricopeptide (TPR) repeat protein